MLRACEIQALSLVLAKASDGKLCLKRESVKSYQRDGGEALFYLTVVLVDPIDIEAMVEHRFHAEFYINGVFHPLNISVLTAEKLELEKWDDRTVLPDDSDLGSISLEGIEAY